MRINPIKRAVESMEAAKNDGISTEQYIKEHPVMYRLIVIYGYIYGLCEIYSGKIKAVTATLLLTLVGSLLFFGLFGYLYTGNAWKSFLLAITVWVGFIAFAVAVAIASYFTYKIIEWWNE